ncbi:hypothetical protein LU683_16725 [Pseudomonas asiatica]|uniref:hypothetical protein n=1 Tax=Pseudomonas TaxID=286 RepID=UPI001E54EC74|nr:MULTISPECIES: hypothetical protein [Pseudomonas]MCE0754537.1 hypothetical protein [Pseudomonas asiatica]
MGQLDTPGLQGQLEINTWSIKRPSFACLGQLKTGLVAAKKHLVAITAGTFLVDDTDCRVTDLVDTDDFNNLVAMQAANLSVFCDVFQLDHLSAHKFVKFISLLECN